MVINSFCETTKLVRSLLLREIDRVKLERIEEGEIVEDY
jgi:hypothetical protein